MTIKNGGGLCSNQQIIMLYKMWAQKTFTRVKMAKILGISLITCKRYVYKFEDFGEIFDVSTASGERKVLQAFITYKSKSSFRPSMSDCFFPTQCWIEERLNAFLNHKTSINKIWEEYKELSNLQDKPMFSRAFFYRTYIADKLKNYVSFTYFIAEEDIISLAALVGPNFKSMIRVYLTKKHPFKTYVSVKRSALFLVSMVGGRKHIYQPLESQLSKRKYFTLRNFIAAVEAKQPKVWDGDYFAAYTKLKKQYQDRTMEEILQVIKTNYLIAKKRGSKAIM